MNRSAAIDSLNHSSNGLVQISGERAVLVRVNYHDNAWSAEAALEELALLCETAELTVVGSVTQNREHPHPRSYVGSGKLAEVAELREQMSADVVVFDDELAPAQMRNVERELDVKIIDRPTLILDIFARHAVTREGRLQVELAQLEYRLPRLTRMWTHLSRQAVGGVGLRGPGETQLEVDRRLAESRIHQIKRQLDQVHRHRELYRQRRRSRETPIIALVGYTNAGKSTLLNRLSNAEVIEEDKLFATLDPTTRRISLPSGRTALVTDTVGFINNLPPTLIAAFRATLEEIEEATVLLHVLDVTHPYAAEQADTVIEILDELGVDDKPMVTALNKVDQLDARAEANLALSLDDDSRDYVPISARDGVGIDELLQQIDDHVSALAYYTYVEVRIPYSETQLVDVFHRRGQVESEEYQESGTCISGHLPRKLVSRFEPYLLSSVEEPVGEHV